jgi:hypothetical protein
MVEAHIEQLERLDKVDAAFQRLSGRTSRP